MAHQVNEQVTALLTGIFKDEAGNLLGSANMTALVGTLYDRKTGTVINGFNEKNLLNANGGTLDGSGNFSLLLTPADNAIVDQSVVGSEVHVLLLAWEYSGGKKGKQEIEIAVKNISKVS
jgi:hypothetical protein